MSMVVDNQHHQRPSESSPSEMNESDHRLLLLASVSQSKREQLLRSVTEEHESLAAHASVGGSPFMSYNDFVQSATAVSKNMTGYYDVTVRHLPQPVVSHTTPSETVVRPLFNHPAPQLLENYRGCHQYNSMGGAAASMQMRHNNYHQHLMSMSMGGLSPSTLKLLMQGVPPPQQMQKMQPMPKARKQKRTATSQEDEGPLKKKTKKDDTKASQPPPPPQVPLVKKDEKKKPIVVFPNQEIYSQMLQIKALSNKPGPLHIHFKQDTLLSKKRLTLSSSPSSSGETTFFHQDQEQALNIQSKFLQMEMKRNEGQRERRTRQLLLEEERRRQFEDLAVTLAETKKMGQLVDDYPPVGDSRMGMPLGGGNVTQLNSSMGVPQDDPYFHALFLRSNQFGVSRLHQRGVDGRIVNGLNVDELGRRFMV